jgi:hypothetical protein
VSFLFAHSVSKGTMGARHQQATTANQGGFMGDKSPKSKDKNKKQGEAQKKKGKADAAAKQTPPAAGDKKK